jgi:hypothetical protein
VNTTARPSFSNSFGSAAERLKIAPFGARAEQRDQPADRLQRLASGARHCGRPDRPAPPAARPASRRRRQAIEMQQRLQLAQHRADAAGGEQILHVMRPVGFRSTSTGVVSLISLSRFSDIDPGAAGDRGQMQHRVGRAADRHQHAQRVLDRFLGDDLVGRDLAAERHRRAARSPRRRAAGRRAPRGSRRCPAGSCRAPR